MKVVQESQHVPDDACYFRFDQEVQSIVRYLEPTKGEKLLRDFLVYRIKETIESAFPGSEVEVFGSFATDMYLPNR